MTPADRERLEFILQGQQHCDHFLTPLAEPAGKRVLVVGVGAGTEMLWCLGKGAREVVGIDIAPQDPTALVAAAETLGIDVDGRFSIEQLAVEDAAGLAGGFELIVSNNVFEHLADVPRALEVCASMLDLVRGRLAIFTAPLFYSSAGAHLSLEPWQHLWEDAASQRQRAPYLFEQITLNRLRLAELINAVVASDLVIVNLRLVRDRNLAALPILRTRMPEHAATDLAIEGVGLELTRVAGLAGDGTGPLVSTEEVVQARRWLAAEHEIERLGAEVEAARAQLADHAQALQQVEAARAQLADHAQALQQVEASLSFRLGRALTAPARWLRERRPWD